MATILGTVSELLAHVLAGHTRYATPVVAGVECADGKIRAQQGTDAGAALVSIADSALPLGAATSALQTILNALVETPTTPSAITKSDSTDTTAITAKGILVGGAGNVVVRGVGSTTDVTIAAVAGQYIPLQASRVMAATTATGLVGLS
jgi:hypothetical protein